MRENQNIIFAKNYLLNTKKTMFNYCAFIMERINKYGEFGKNNEHNLPKKSSEIKHKKSCKSIYSGVY